MAVLFNLPHTAKVIKVVNMTEIRSDSYRNTRCYFLTGIIAPVTGGFPSQRAGNTENVSIWWRRISGNIYKVLDDNKMLQRAI